MVTSARKTTVKPGDIVEGRYRIISTVDEGGMGTVFLAEHVLIKRRVALKILHPELATDPDVIERFMNEARAAGTLGHPNIVESTDMGFTRNDVPYIVFEYLEGTLLTDEIYRLGSLPVRRALKIAEQIASALLAAHNANIVHRDLKSDNVYLTDKDDVPDHVKVLDFGISRLEGVIDDQDPGQVMGTPEYMAPEQVTSPETVDHRADIYALGVILYEMLTGKVPFSTTGDRHALVHRIVHEEPPPLERPDAPVGLREMIQGKLLPKDPAKRYQSMKIVLGALEAFRSVTRPTLVPAPRAKRSTAAGVGAVAASTATPATGPRRPSPSSAPPVGATRVAPASEARLEQSAQKRGRGRIGWLVAAVVAAGGGGALTYLDGRATAAADPAVRAALEAGADKIGTTIDSVTRGAQLRADGIATTPMLRAAVETDAATLRDMSKGDLVFTVNTGETLEVFQVRASTTSSMLRLPASAAALTPSVDHKPAIDTDGASITIHVSAPVAGYKPDINGSVELVVPVDLAAVRSRVSPHVLEASLVGLAKPISLVPAASPEGTTLRVPVPLAPDVFGGALTLTARIAPPVRDESFRVPRNACFIGSGGLLGIYLLSLLLARRRG